MNLSWDSEESSLLSNPSYSQSEQERFNRILDAAHSFPSHIWLSTSGSSVQKWVGLSKKALLSSACAVNQHLFSNENDAWVNALPHFHVGGLSILARAHLSGARIYDFKKGYPGKWNAEIFYHYLVKVEGTLTALVPAQLHDLVVLGKRSPDSLRALIIGGGALLPHLYTQAVELGWPVLPSYGLTECASQVATASYQELQAMPCGQVQMPPLQLLSHMQVRVEEGRLCFSAP